MFKVANVRFELTVAKIFFFLQSQMVCILLQLCQEK